MQSAVPGSGLTEYTHKKKNPKPITLRSESSEGNQDGQGLVQKI